MQGGQRVCIVSNKVNHSTYLKRLLKGVFSLSE